MTTGARFLRAPHLEARAADERDQTGRLHCLGQLCLAAAQQPSFSSNAKWPLDWTAGSRYPSEAAAALAGRRALTAGEADRAPAALGASGYSS